MPRDCTEGCSTFDDEQSFDWQSIPYNQMKRFTKPAMKIGNAARTAVQREIKHMASSNPLTREGYALLESLVKKQKKSRKKGGKGGGNEKSVSAPAIMGTQIRGGNLEANGFENRVVSGTETFLSVYRPNDSSYDAGGIFDVTANTAGFSNLAREATNYQFYRFTQLEFTYEPVSATQTQGQIIFGTLADPTDPEPVSLEETRAITNSVTTPVWTKCTLKVPCDKTDRYVDGDKNSSSDVRFQVAKRFFIGSTSVSVGQATGLWTVRYRCQLSKRKPNSTIPGAYQLDITNQPFSQYFDQPKSNSYYQLSQDGTLKFNTSGRLRIQFAIQMSTDQAIPDLVITNNGNTVTPTVASLFRGYTNITDTNYTLLLISLSLVLSTRGAILNLTPLKTLLGSGSLMLSIEPDGVRSN